MQQTQTYKLNKPGTDDPIAIAPLNENMEKIEAALTAEAQARAEADAAETQARQAAVNSEAQTRAAADASEAQTRANADAAEIQARQAAVDSEAQTRAAADAAEVQARQAAVAAEAQARQSALAPLSQRVTVLEAGQLRIATGSYTGDGSKSKFMSTGFTPKMVMIRSHFVANRFDAVAVTGVPCKSSDSIVEIVEGGFLLTQGTDTWSPLYQNYLFMFVAIG